MTSLLYHSVILATFAIGMKRELVDGCVVLFKRWRWMGTREKEERILSSTRLSEDRTGLDCSALFCFIPDGTLTTRTVVVMYCLFFLDGWMPNTIC